MILIYNSLYILSIKRINIGFAVYICILMHLLIFLILLFIAKMQVNKIFILTSIVKLSSTIIRGKGNPSPYGKGACHTRH